jgi:hypothetical protein
LEQLILVGIEPLVGFAGSFPALGLLPGSIGVPMDGGISLTPYAKELLPDGGEYCS